MHDARPEVAGRVDRVARRPAERQPDPDHQQADDQRAEARLRGRHVVEEREDPEHQHERPDDLGDDVADRVADRRRRAEARQLEPGILGLLPVVEVREPHERRADERADELAGEVLGHVAASRSFPPPQNPIVTAGFRCAPLNCPTAKAPVMTARPQPNVITTQPPFWPFDWASSTHATTPLPSKIRSAVPMTSAPKMLKSPLLLRRALTQRDWTLDAARLALSTGVRQCRTMFG